MTLYISFPFFILFFIQVASIHGHTAHGGKSYQNFQLQPREFDPVKPLDEVNKVEPIGDLPSSNSVVVIGDGALRGFMMRTASSRPILAFQGIPFGQPPVGPLRFRVIT